MVLWTPSLLPQVVSHQGLGHSPKKRNYKSCRRGQTWAAVFELSAEVHSPALKQLSLQSDANPSNSHELTLSPSLLFIHLPVAENWNQPSCPSVDEYVMKIWCVCVCACACANVIQLQRKLNLKICSKMDGYRYIILLKGHTVLEKGTYSVFYVNSNE